MRVLAAGHRRASGLLWLTGAPGSGKTTVGDAMHDLLVEGGLTNVVRLDGDALRQFLHLTTVESDEDRVTLGLSYVALADHLARQGQVVILSAVAMYDEVFEAFHALEDVPTALVRLSTTAPDGPDIRYLVDVHNPMDGDPHSVAASVIAVCESHRLLEPRHSSPVRTQADIVRYARGSATRRRHWDAYYRHGSVPDGPSSFARALIADPRVAGGSTSDQLLVDFGCGNGRDSRFLAEHFRVLGLDASPGAVDAARAASNAVTSPRLAFDVSVLDELKAQLAEVDPAIVYSRFVLHALSPEEESRFLDAVAHGCRPGTLLAIEARTGSDPMARRGSKVSANERVHGHYRRFLDVDEFHEALAARGFAILESTRAQGVSSLGDDDPEVLRVLARV